MFTRSAWWITGLAPESAVTQNRVLADIRLETHTNIECWLSECRAFTYFCIRGAHLQQCERAAQLLARHFDIIDGQSSIDGSDSDADDEDDSDQDDSDADERGGDGADGACGGGGDKQAPGGPDDDNQGATDGATDADSSDRNSSGTGMGDRGGAGNAGDKNVYSPDDSGTHDHDMAGGNGKVGTTAALRCIHCEGDIRHQGNSSYESPSDYSDCSSLDSDFYKNMVDGLSAGGHSSGGDANPEDDSGASGHDEADADRADDAGDGDGKDVPRRR